MPQSPTPPSGSERLKLSLVLFPVGVAAASSLRPGRRPSSALPPGGRLAWGVGATGLRELRDPERDEMEEDIPASLSLLAMLVSQWNVDSLSSRAIFFSPPDGKSSLTGRLAPRKHHSNRLQWGVAPA